MVVRASFRAREKRVELLLAGLKDPTSIRRVAGSQRHSSQPQRNPFVLCFVSSCLRVCGFRRRSDPGFFIQGMNCRRVLEGAREGH